MKNKNIIVLVNPDIPYNTGNIGRTCVIANAELHLVKPLGFSLDDKYIKRSGMDYWQDIDLTVWENLDEFSIFLEEKVESGEYQAIYCTTKAKKTIGELNIDRPAIIILGSESAGLPEDWMSLHPDRCYRIPMSEHYRSLNLSNSEAIVLYEVLRQQGYPELH